MATDRDLDAARVTAEQIGGEARLLDVTDPAPAAEVAEQVAAGHGGIGVWVPNAVISKMQRFIDISPADLRQTLAVNLEGVFLCGQAAARVMIGAGQPGTIVNVASMAGKQGRVPYLADYVASKFAVVGLTQAMAFELAPHHITVNLVCPGYVATPMQDRELGWEAALRGVAPEQVRQMWVDDTPLGRLETHARRRPRGRVPGRADARFITGEALAVNGGAFMDLPPKPSSRTGRGDCGVVAVSRDGGRRQHLEPRPGGRSRAQAGPSGALVGYWAWMIPCAIARVMSWARLWTPAMAIMFAIWLFTVASLRFRAMAALAVVFPRQSSRGRRDGVRSGVVGNSSSRPVRCS